VTTVLDVEPTRLGRALVDLAEWLADPQTPTFVGRTLTAQDGGDSRYYPDPDDPTTQYKSVTWILGATQRKPYLERWHGTTAAKFAVRNWAMLGEILASAGEQAAIEWVMSEAERVRSVKSEAGRWQHDVLEALLLDRPIPDPPAWLVGMEMDGEPLTQHRLDRWADGLTAFLSDYRPHVLMSEATVLNPPEGIGGTLDCGAILPHYGPTLVDLKSGRTVDRTTPLQLEAYRRMRQVVLPLGERAEMPLFERTAVLHLRTEYQYGYKLLPMPSGRAVWSQFLDARRQLRRRAEYPPSWDTDGHLVAPPVLPMVEDVDTAGFPRSVLAGAGMEWLTDLTQFTTGELLTVKGIGPKRVDAIRAALSAHGLALLGEQLGEVA
jgi:hypothetical protein